MKIVNIGWLALFALLFLAPTALAQSAPIPANAVSILNSVDLRAPLQSPGLSTPLQLMFLMAALTLLPFLVIVSTSFIRTVVVLAILKQALGLQNVPPGQVIMGLALFLTMYTMAPTWDAVQNQSITPFLNHRITQEQMFQKAAAPLQTFMVKQTNQGELAFFLRLAKVPDPKSPTDIPFQVAVPAFIISELTTAFKIGFIIFLPFVVVDLVINTVILALGMQNLQANMITPPFKVLIFTLANGWHLIAEALVKSFH